jgi:ribose transport system permease protein
MGALFLSQLEQLVLTTGVNNAIQYLIEAAAIVAGVAIYNVRWGRVRDWFGGRRRVAAPLSGDDERGPLEKTVEA